MPSDHPPRPPAPCVTTGRGRDLAPILLYPHEDLSAPILYPRACPSTRTSSPKDLRVLALYLAPGNVTGRKAEALRALVTPEVSKCVHGEARVCHHHPRGWHGF